MNLRPVAVADLLLRDVVADEKKQALHRRRDPVGTPSFR